MAEAAMQSRPARLRLMPIASLALVLRLAVVAQVAGSHSAAWFFGQASELTALAASLLSSHCLCSPFGGTTGPSAFLAPGYPALVAAVFALLHPASHSSAVAIMLLQAVFGAATAAVLMLFTRRAFGIAAANVAGLIWALSPPAIYLPILFWETSLSILLGTAIVTLSLWLRDDPTLRLGAALGVTMAAAVCVNPSLLPIALGCVGWIAYRLDRRSLAAPALAAALLVALSAPWAVRNAVELHAFIPLRSNLGYELWQGNRPDSDGFFEPDLHPNINREEFSQYKQLGEVRYMADKSTAARDLIAARPGRFLTLTARRAFDFWTGIVRHSAGLVVGSIVLTSLLGFAGLTRLWLRNRALAAFFTLPLIFFPLPYYITHPDFRFRLVLDPILIALAAWWLTTRGAAKQSR
jgi:hypothetical protein